MICHRINDSNLMSGTIVFIHVEPRHRFIMQLIFDATPVRSCSARAATNPIEYQMHEHIIQELVRYYHNTHSSKVRRHDVQYKINYFAGLSMVKCT